MKKLLCLLLLSSVILSLVAISYSDAEFCLNKELWQILDKHQKELRDSALSTSGSKEWTNLLMIYAGNQSDTLTVLLCYEHLAITQRDFEQAIAWHQLAGEYAQSHPEFPLKQTSETLSGLFTDDADKLLLQVFRDGTEEDSLYQAISKLNKYNSYIEEMAKGLVDEISVERNDSLSFALTNKFYDTFPRSDWRQCIYYFELSHYSALKDYQTLLKIIQEKYQDSYAHAYVSTLFLLSPTLRRELKNSSKSFELIQWGKSLLDSLLQAKPQTIKILYDSYTPEHWTFRLKLQQAKAMYYNLINSYGYYGDEDSLQAILRKITHNYTKLNKHLSEISYSNNDTGEIAELHFWRGKTLSLSRLNKHQLAAAKCFITCLELGAPRKKYDVDAIAYLTKIYKRLRIKPDIMTWSRDLKNYKGTIFKDITVDSGFPNNRETRVAIGDFDNDSFADILLNGKRLYRNNGNLTFTELTDSLGLDKLNSSGGLFADFNLDGKLDFAAISHSEDGNGDKLLKNMGGKFASVNDRAGDIDDKFPTEGAAWVDAFNDEYPDLYCANYEKWQVQDGYPDFFWYNKKGYFADKTSDFGFLTPSYTHDNGQCGRGVAPADFDNDGEQEIYVCNYRLDRNFLWDRQDTTFTDLAAINGLQGVFKKGYYGHSIGADWGDYDNDGDLDLFVANLAHPRFIDISDISALYRNDGFQTRVIEGDTIRYWQFTNVTPSTGIKFDELHSDPLWFDADNDGWLDLFITSVYENDRSYLYHNNGDGTFTDITWLSGVRVYNGWGNAFADFNHDGRLDLVVGSGNGTKVFLNQTQNKNHSIVIKPIWKDGSVSLVDAWSNMPDYPNSPAFGSRVILYLKSPAGKKIQIIRELSSAKGTTSQSEQVLHFGTGRNKLLYYELFKQANN